MIGIDLGNLDDIHPISNAWRLCFDQFINQLEDRLQLIPGKEEDLVGPVGTLNIVDSIIPLSHDPEIMASAPQSPEQIRICLI